MTTNSKILVVDDTPAALDVLDDLLTPLGYELLFARDGFAALETAVSQTPDLILLDVMMPRMDGFEVCRRLRSDSTTADVPVILVTALNDRRSRIKGIEAGADDFLTKPFDRYELQARVKTITRLNRYRRLVAERQKFEHVVNHAATGYLILDPQERVTFANPQAQRYLGERFDETDAQAQRPFREWAATSFRMEPAAAWTSFPQPPDTESPRYLITPETEMLRGQWLQVDVMPYSDDAATSFLVTLQDVTYQMEEVRDMRNFHKMIHHKLRTPLIGLVSGLDVIGRWSKDLTPEQFTELVEIAQVSIDRLHGQVEDILQYTKLPIIAREEDYFSLSELPRLLGRIAVDVEVDTVYLTQPEGIGDCQITPSSGMMELVLYELFENAHKFHPEQMPVLEVGIECLDEYVQLTVSDNGRHLAAEQLEQVWTPYYQAEKFFTGEVPGMGLGLPTVASLMWQANGKCHLYNRPDQQGITVELLLPIARKPEHASPGPALEAAGSGVAVPTATPAPVTTRIL